MPALPKVTFKAIVFTSRQDDEGKSKFFADVIPENARGADRITGTYEVQGSKVTLTLENSEWTVASAGGVYSARVSAGELTLTKNGQSMTLYQHTSYCAEPVDCGQQNLFFPACVGNVTCNNNACGFHCGVPAPIH
jgi:hypothetical protein